MKLRLSLSLVFVRKILSLKRKSKHCLSRQKNQLTQPAITIMPVTTAAIINALIPLAVGILFVSYPEQLLPAKDRADEKNGNV